MNFTTHPVEITYAGIGPAGFLERKTDFLEAYSAILRRLSSPLRSHNLSLPLCFTVAFVIHGRCCAFLPELLSPLHLLRFSSELLTLLRLLRFSSPPRFPSPPRLSSPPPLARCPRIDSSRAEFQSWCTCPCCDQLFSRHLHFSPGSISLSKCMKPDSVSITVFCLSSS